MVQEFYIEHLRVFLKGQPNKSWVLNFLRVQTLGGERGSELGKRILLFIGTLSDCESLYCRVLQRSFKGSLSQRRRSVRMEG